MLEATQGSITIDGIDISTVPHDHVRSSIVAIPQDTAILDGSIRFNVDSTESLSDDVIIASLDKLELWQTIQSRGGLDALIDSTLLSHGQLQLLVFARAMCRKGKVLVLDEATSSLDEQTAEIVDKVLADCFADWTVIVVAHKVDSLLGYDRVAVLDQGRLIEFDEPRKLLARQSAFGQLYEASVRRGHVDGMS